jgi:hypothetical protein
MASNELTIVSRSACTSTALAAAAAAAAADVNDKRQSDKREKWTIHMNFVKEKNILVESCVTEPKSA